MAEKSIYKELWRLTKVTNYTNIKSLKIDKFSFMVKFWVLKK